MRSVFIAFLSASLVVVLLRSDLTPWRIVNRTEPTPANQTLNNQPRENDRRILVPVAAPVDHSGDWMRDPNYRSALERTTIVGHPEPAASRDPRKPTATPYRRP